MGQSLATPRRMPSCNPVERSSGWDRHASYLMGSDTLVGPLVIFVWKDGSNVSWNYARLPDQVFCVN